MVALAEVQAHRTDVTQIAQSAQSDIRILLGQVSTPAEARVALMDTLPELLGIYGAASATLGADWYEDLRDLSGVRGSFTAVVPELPDAGRAYALAGAATSPLKTGELTLGTVSSIALGGAQRFVADMDRGAVQASTAADRRAVGWQRVGSGECGFCTMLISRGAVYTESSVRFGSHDNCKCAAVPAWGGEPLTVTPYTPTTRRVSDADRARVREWIKANT